jgi:hypothetical protein
VNAVMNLRVLAPRSKLDSYASNNISLWIMLKPLYSKQFVISQFTNPETDSLCNLPLQSCGSPALSLTSGYEKQVCEMENSLPPTPEVLLRLQDLGSNLGPGDWLFRLIFMIFHIPPRQMLKSTGSRPQPLHFTFFPIHICSHHNSTLYDLRS